MSTPRPAMSLVDAQALEWQVVFWSGEVQEHEQQDFQIWLAADPLHEQAWARIQQFGQQMQLAPQEVASQVLQAGLSAQAVQRRRAILRSFLLLVCGGLGSYGVSRTPQWAAWNADYRTASGQRKELTLPDGTALALNTASSLNVQYSETQRSVVLLGGEVLISTASDPQIRHRPFVVQTPEGEVQALGTRFLVRHWPSKARVSVQVYEGAVELRPRHAGQRTRLQAGQQVLFSKQQSYTPEPANEQASAWQRGLLVAERWRLGDFLAEVARYRAGVLRCDPAVAGLMISGVYPLQDTDAILQSVSQALPVQVRMMTPYWVTVSASA
ncbi:FecR domain-containing protein [Alcaligenes sp. MMA]|uniref:FecR domain-containing protein n=1 Tax=Alcaligenes sp. MMA TaxID=2893019 RepID=UPI001E61C03A|nr:FecR domain-containing protein [Alcaligenes sp. MMA]MCC9165027.1 FecR domain-containing protein [Alcaligenes sp. MMA]